MDLSNWPTEADVCAELAKAGLTELLDDAHASPLDVASELASAVEEFERRTRWVPFLAAEGPESRYYDPPGPDSGRAGGYSGAGDVGGGRMLWLDGGLVELTSLAVAVSPEDGEGEPLTAGTDFWLFPRNAAQRRLPVTGIEFRRRQHGQPASIKVEGRFGRCSPLPADAWRAVLCRAAASAYDALRTLVETSGGADESRRVVQRVRYGDQDVEFASTQTEREALKKGWEAAFESACKRYRRPNIA